MGRNDVEEKRLSKTKNSDISPNPDALAMDRKFGRKPNPIVMPAMV